MDIIDSKEIKVYRDSARIIQDLGNIEIDGVLLKDYLRFKGVSLWDLVAPLLASHRLPEVIFRKRRHNIVESCSSFYQKRMKSYLKAWWTYYVREVRDCRNGSRSLSQEGDNAQTKVLYLCFEPRQIEDFVSVMGLINNRRFRIEIVGSKYRENRDQFFNGTNRKFLAIEAFFGDIREEVKEDRRILKKRLKELKKEISKCKLRYNSIPVWRLLKDDFANLSVYLFFQLVKEIRIADKIVSIKRPDIIVGADDCNPRQRVYFLIGKSVGIPTLVVQQGLANEKAVDWMFLSCDKIATLGEYTKNLLKDMGIDEDRLVITGQPRFDRLIKEKNIKEEVCRDLGVNSAHRIILFTCQPYVAGSFPSEQIRKKMIETIYCSAGRIGETVLIVKPHPGESSSIHQRLKAKTRSNSVIITDRDADIHRLILGSDLLITHHSTTGLEAMIADKPVIVFDVTGHFSSVSYLEGGAAIAVSSGEELVTAIHDIFDKIQVRKRLRDGREKFVHHHACNMDGMASQRVYDLILQMIGEGGR